MTALTPPVAMDPPYADLPVVPQAMGRNSPQVLTDLREAMNLAQVTVMAARRPPAAPIKLKAARIDYLAAMVAYERALTICRLPVPPRLRDEVRLLRRLTTMA